MGRTKSRYLFICSTINLTKLRGHTSLSKQDSFADLSDRTTLEIRPEPGQCGKSAQVPYLLQGEKPNRREAMQLHKARRTNRPAASPTLRDSLCERQLAATYRLQNHQHRPPPTWQYLRCHP